MITSFSVIAEDIPLIAEDISATLQTCFPTSTPRIFVSFGHARQTIFADGAQTLVTVSMSLRKIQRLLEEDLAHLKKMTVLWIDVAPDIRLDGLRWHVLAKPFTHQTLSDALLSFPPINGPVRSRCRSTVA